MPSKLYKLWSNPSYRRLSLALIVSVLLHLALVKGMGLHYPAWWNKPEPTAMTIQAVLQLPAKPVPAPPSKPVSKLAPKPAAKIPVAKAPSAMLAKPVAPPQPDPAPQPEPQPQASPPPEPAIEAAKPDEQQAVVPEVPAAPDAIAENAESLVSKAPSFVQTDFIVRKGNATGIMHNTYEMQPGGSYILKSEAEAKGLLALFLGRLKQQSEGVVTDQGLKPYRYSYQYGNSEDKLQRADFDWRGGKLTLQYDKKTKVQPLTEGTQDLLSFMYQFMFVPPLAQMELSITNGKKLDSYRYAFEGEETLSTKMGDLRTLHISRTRGDSDDKTELWLATDYYNLPVKVRQTEKDGGVIEQIATRISTNDAGQIPAGTAP